MTGSQTAKNFPGGSEGRSPPSCIPNPATCAVDSEALRSKVSLHVSPAAPQAQGKRVLSEKAAAGGLFRHAETGGALSPSGLRFRRPFRVPTEASSSLRVPLPDGIPAPEAGPAAFRRAGRFPSLGIRAQTDSPGNGAGSAPVRTTGGNAGPPAAAARLLRDGAACSRPDQA